MHDTARSFIGPHQREMERSRCCFLIVAAALLQGSSTPAPDSTGARNPAYRARRASRRQRRGRPLGRLEVGRMDARDVGAGVGPRAGVDAPTARRSSSRRIAPATSISGAWRWRRTARAASRSDSRRRRCPTASRPSLRDGRIVFVRGRLGAAASVGSLDDRRRVAPHEGSRGGAMAGDFARRHAPRVRLDRRRARESCTCARSTTGATAPCSPTRASSVRRGRRPAIDSPGRRRARAAPCTSRRSTDATSIVVSARHAESAWNPDGKTIALADIPPTDADRAGRLQRRSRSHG